MVIPALVEELYESHPALSEASGQEAVVGETGLAWFRAIHLVHILGLARDIHQLRHRGLHAVGHLILTDPGLDLRIADIGKAQVVEVFHRIDHLASI